MVDTRDTTGMNAAGSNGSQSPYPGNPASSNHSKDIDEARIVDEVIVRPPASSPPKELQPHPIPPPAPVPTATPASIPVPLTPPKIPTLAPATMLPNVSPAEIQSIAHDSLDERPVSSLKSAEYLPPQISEKRVPPPQNAPRPISPAPPTSTLAPARPFVPTPPAPPPATEPLPKEDVQKILKEVRLPERKPVPNESIMPKQKTTYDTTLASPLTPSRGEHTVTQSQQSSKINPQSNSEEKAPMNPSSIVAPVHTLKNDFQEIVRERKISLVRAAALEQDKRRNLDKRYDITNTTHKRRMLGVVFVSIVLALLGTAAFLGVAFIIQQRNGVAVRQENSSLLFAESSLPLPMENLTSLDIKRLLSQARVSQSTLGSITRIVPTVSDLSSDAATERPATLEEFLTAIGARTAPELIRALGSDFFFGFHTVDENAPVLVIPVVSYERAFAGMLAWEKTLNADLQPIFTAVPSTVLGGDGLLEERQFKDIVMRNYDVRALTDDSGTIQTYYSFPTRDLLVIAESPYSFAEILARLRAERKL